MKRSPIGKAVLKLGRPLLASMFVAGGLDSLRHPKAKAATAAPVTDKVAEATRIEAPPEQWVQVNGAVQVVGGLALATGVLPRMAALALGGSLVPTTLAGHRFWEEEDADKRTMQRIQFLKNASMLGGLLVAAA